MFKKNFNCALWLGLLNLPLACYFGLSYLPKGDSPWFVLCTFFFALIGQLFVYFAIIALILIFPVFNWQKKIGWAKLLYVVLILSVSHSLLNLDAFTYEVYDQHIFYYLAHIEDYSVAWQNADWLHLSILFLIIVGYSCLIMFLAQYFAQQRALYWPFVLIVMFMYILSSGVFMFAQMRQVEPLIEVENKNLPRFIDIKQIFLKMHEVMPVEREEGPILPPAQYGPEDGSYIQPSVRKQSEQAEQTHHTKQAEPKEQIAPSEQPTEEGSVGESVERQDEPSEGEVGKIARPSTPSAEEVGADTHNRSEGNLEDESSSHNHNSNSSVSQEQASQQEKSQAASVDATDKEVAEAEDGQDQSESEQVTLVDG